MSPKTHVFFQNIDFENLGFLGTKRSDRGLIFIVWIYYIIIQIYIKKKKKKKF